MGDMGAFPPSEEELIKAELGRLLEHFAKTTYRAKDHDPEAQHTIDKCFHLLDQDYKYVTVSNTQGELSTSYPSQLAILEEEKTKDPAAVVDGKQQSNNNGSLSESNNGSSDPAKLKDLFGKARFARCRARFPVPVILYKGRRICRSATLSGGPEIYGRSGLDYFFSSGGSGDGSNQEMYRNVGEDGDGEEEGEIVVPQTQSEWQLFDRVRSQDIRLLKTLGVGTIVDLMVEKKKVKFGVNVTSSEKVDKENRYSEFTIISLPYPGCEFFQDFRDNHYEAAGLVFDWNQTHVDASICVPSDPISCKVRVDWKQYKAWDVVRMTKNYLRLMLQHVLEGQSGVLVHCISGWDRTPLFISLLRLSLWADGAAHASLTPSQILYLTIAYDWMLFGHNLQDRLSKGEEIFFFCFYFLKYLASDEFSVNNTTSKWKNSVMHTDSDSHLERLMFEAEGRSSMKGSNTSLNSSSSSLSTKSQEVPSMYFYSNHDSSSNDEQGNNGYSHHQFTWPPGYVEPLLLGGGGGGSGNSPNMGSGGVFHHVVALDPANGNRTSPVAVPVPEKFRQRNESTGSLSIGSWQIISGTGSLRGSTSNSESGNTPNSVNSQQIHNFCECPETTDSSSTLVEDGLLSHNSGCNEVLNRRKERLDAVRSLFYATYSTSVGFHMNSGHEPSGFSSLLGNFAEKVGIRGYQRSQT